MMACGLAAAEEGKGSGLRAGKERGFIPISSFSQQMDVVCTSQISVEQEGSLIR